MKSHTLPKCGVRREEAAKEQVPGGHGQQDEQGGRQLRADEAAAATVVPAAAAAAAGQTDSHCRGNEIVFQIQSFSTTQRRFLISFSSIKLEAVTGRLINLQSTSSARHLHPRQTNS